MANQVYITVQEFAERLSISEAKALQMARRKDLCDKGIAIDANLGASKKKTMPRIHWRKYEEYAATYPALPKDKRCIRRVI